ncbi:uncharacterized protein VTP21DRAFT_752 [Calcarisporiella thermophila]|uniref:uncharacterized protein n=1 Tax=Calcarisporiella thermophila TaxID=911321 RepID=UPI0037429195
MGHSFSTSRSHDPHPPTVDASDHSPASTPSPVPAHPAERSSATPPLARSSRALRSTSARRRRRLFSLYPIISHSSGSSTGINNSCVGGSRGWNGLQSASSGSLGGVAGNGGGAARPLGRLQRLHGMLRSSTPSPSSSSSSSHPRYTRPVGLPLRDSTYYPASSSPLDQRRAQSEESDRMQYNPMEEDPQLHEDEPVYSHIEGDYRRLDDYDHADYGPEEEGEKEGDEQQKAREHAGERNPTAESAIGGGDGMALDDEDENRWQDRTATRNLVFENSSGERPPSLYGPEDHLDVEYGEGWHTRRRRHETRDDQWLHDSQLLDGGDAVEHDHPSQAAGGNTRFSRVLASLVASTAASLLRRASSGQSSTADFAGPHPASEAQRLHSSSRHEPDGDQPARGGEERHNTAALANFITDNTLISTLERMLSNLERQDAAAGENDDAESGARETGADTGLEPNTTARGTDGNAGTGGDENPAPLPISVNSMPDISSLGGMGSSGQMRFFRIGGPPEGADANEAGMVPVLFVGIRSIDRPSASRHGAEDNGTEAEDGESVVNDAASITTLRTMSSGYPFSMYNDSAAPGNEGSTSLRPSSPPPPSSRMSPQPHPHVLSSAASSSSSYSSSSTNTTALPPGPPLSGQGLAPPSHRRVTRTYVIFIIGGTFPSGHPILTSPSLLSDQPTYEDLLRLAAVLGPARPPTTTQDAIDSALPCAAFDKTLGQVPGFELLGTGNSCQVCLTEYGGGDMVRILRCRHGFHRECIDKWLTEGANKCPICRAAAVEEREAGNTTTDESAPTPPMAQG